MPFFPRSSSKRSQRRRRGDGDDGLRLEFEVESFEFVSAGDDVGLLRIAGHWFADPDRVVPTPIELEIERDGQAERIEPLPDPTGALAIASPDGEPWRAAFMAPAELAEDPRADFALAAADQVVAGLPRPGDWAASPELSLVEGDEPAEDELDDAAALYAVEDAPVEDLPAGPPADPIEALVEDDQADPVAEHVSARIAAEERADAAVAEFRRIDAELDVARAAAQVAAGELDKARSAGDDADSRADALRAQLEQAGASLEAALAEIEAERGRSDAMQTQLADAIAHRQEAQAHSADAPADGKAELLKTELADARAQLNRERGLRELAEEKLEHATGDTAAESLQAKLAAVSEQLDQARAELEVEHRRRATVEDELRVQVGTEGQLRDSLAVREAELAAADSQAARRARASERRREPGPGPGGARTPHPVGADFFDRIEQAKRLSETSPPPAA